MTMTRRVTRQRLFAIRFLSGLLASLVPVLSLHAQSAGTASVHRGEEARDTNVAVRQGVRERKAWIASSAALGVAFVFDERLRSVAMANHSKTLDGLASGADVLGTAGHIVPALVTSYVGARLFHRRSFADATLRVGVCYLAADAIESLLKPAVGRIRPDAGREPLTFRPFSVGGDYHSFPSAHVVHIASLSSAIAMEADRPWVTGLAAASIAYVEAQRVYRDQHWASDVVASGMLGTAVAQWTMRWMRKRSLSGLP